MNKSDFERMKRSAIMDMSDLLVSYGFNVEDAVNVSTKFWNKNKYKKKLRDAGLW